MSSKSLYLGLEAPDHATEKKIVHCPIIQIVPRPLSDETVLHALNQFSRYTHILVTSKSIIPILNEYLPLCGILLPAWKATPHVAVGKATASRLNMYGITPMAIAHQETAEGVVEELKRLDLSNAHLFWAHSSQSRPVIEQFLTAQGFRYTSCILYDPQTRIPNPLPKLEEFDEIIFTSPSTVDAFLEVFGQFPIHTRIVPIGPITAAYLRQFSPHHLSCPPSVHPPIVSK